ncbi:MAG: hypothetical protein IPJ40_17975 [Saprospirales bacterium]|nr:hypothetical protein [Saprospirales bacterium]
MKKCFGSATWGRAFDTWVGSGLQGTTVYGFGTRETPAQLEILDNDKVLRLRASAELFTIRRKSV